METAAVALGHRIRGHHRTGTYSSCLKVVQMTHKALCQTWIKQANETGCIK